LVVASFLLAIWFVPVLVHAQSKDVTELNPEELRGLQVYSASMYVQDNREAPSSVTVITSDQIRTFGYRTLADILQSVRGFYVTYDRNYSYLGVRGFSLPGDLNDRTLLLVNGHRLTDNVYDSALLGTEFQLDVDLIDRVEIVRGPSSSLYGGSAFFAVVNVITKSAQTLSGLEISGTADGFGTYQGRSTYGMAVHGIDMLFSGTVYESAGPGQLFFPAFNSPQTNHGIAHNADYGSFRSVFSNLHFRHFTLEAVASTRNKGIPTGSFGTIFNDDRTNTTDSRGYVDLQYERVFGQDTDFNTRAYFDRSIYRGLYAYPGKADGAPQLNHDLGRGDWFGVTARVTRTVSGKHKATVGTEFRYNLRQDQSNFSTAPLVVYLQDQRRSHVWALYGQDQFTIRKGLILNAGLRHDYYSTFGGTTNPRLALIYSPLRRTTLKLIFGRAFRAPNYYELFYHDGFSQEANPHLRPERIQTTELVWEQNLSTAFRLSAAAFENRITGLVGEQSDPSNGFLFFQNSRKAHSRGVELEIAGKILHRVEGRISYTLQKTRDETTQTLLANSPEQLVKMNLAVPLLHRALSAGVEFDFVDLRKAVTGDPVPGRFLTNLTLTSREFAGGFRFSGSIYNLFNRGYSDPVGAEVVGSQVPQNGIDFRIELTKTFHFR
jgi:iron complex outermembrane receptor protein